MIVAPRFFEKKCHNCFRCSMYCDVSTSISLCQCLLIDVFVSDDAAVDATADAAGANKLAPLQQTANTANP